MPRNRTRRRGGGFFNFFTTPKTVNGQINMPGLKQGMDPTNAILQTAETNTPLKYNGSFSARTQGITMDATFPGVNGNTSIKAILNADLDKTIATLEQKKGQIKNTQQYWNEYIKAEVAELSGLPQLADQAISGAIATYNAWTRKRFASSVSNNYMCGTITCKQRGEKIKSALTKLISYSPEALGSLGMVSGAKNLGTWGVRKGSQGLANASQVVSNMYQPNPLPQNDTGIEMQPQGTPIGGGRTRRKRR